MTSDHAEHLAQLWRENRDERAIAELVEGHTKLVHKLARKCWYGRKSHWGVVLYIDYDDLVSMGRNGVVRAAESFDPSKGARFITWLHYVLRTVYGHIVITTGGEKRMNVETVSLDAPIHICNDVDALSLHDAVPAKCDSYAIVESRLLKSRIHEELSCLRPNNHFAVSARFFGDMSYADIARFAGMSQQGAHYAIQRSLGMLKKRMGDCV